MHAYLVAAAYNLLRIAKLSPAPRMNHQSTLIFPDFLLRQDFL
jgi:hypothetical protein